MTDVTVPASPELDENTQIALRREKLAALRTQAEPAFPNTFRPSEVAAALHTRYEGMTKEELTARTHPAVYRVAGRVMLRRLMGKASFVTLQDVSGRMQVYLRQNDLPEGVYEQFKTWDLGDIIGVEGTVFRTNTGELSIHAIQIQLLTKALRPLPDKFHGLTDHELRYRQRYLDLIMNPDTRAVFALRSKVVDFIRHYLQQRRFLEVETPMMQVMPGGAVARPFKTYHNALDMPMYLRIAPELYLKRLVVGGFDRVFEINRNFRNEGLSTRHNPEFTMLEFYQAYADYRDLMDLTEDLLRSMAQALLGTAEIHYQGEVYDLSQPFVRMTVVEAILHYNPFLKRAQLENFDDAVRIAETLGINVEKHYGLGKIQIEIFEKTVEAKLFAPTFITEYPAEVSPLARRNDSNPFVTDRFEFFMGGREVANGFSELNDAEDQAERFKAQAAAKDAGDDEAMHYDADYVMRLNTACPQRPARGLGSTGW